MLSDEEKKAIESLKNIAIYMGDNYTFSQQGIRNLRKNLRIVLPAIEKQSKKIEELSDKLTEKICKGVEEEILEEYRQTIISKDKKIEELKIQNNKLAQCHFKYEEMTGVDLLLPDKLEYTSNDKIKAKIEEYEKMKEATKMDTTYYGEKRRSVIESVIGEFQSLLKKE